MNGTCVPHINAWTAVHIPYLFDVCVTLEWLLHKSVIVVTSVIVIRCTFPSFPSITNETRVLPTQEKMIHLCDYSIYLHQLHRFVQVCFLQLLYFSSPLLVPLVTHSVRHLLLSARTGPNLSFLWGFFRRVPFYHQPALFLHIILVPCSLTKEALFIPELHRNSSYFYSGHILRSDCPDKMRPSLIFKSLFPARITVSIITQLFKDSKVCHAKKEQENKVVLMF